MYNLVFSDLAKKQFNKLEKNIQERIGTVLERIKIRPHAFVEKVVGEPGYKLRVGDYRIFIDIFNKELIVFVIKIGYRKNIYKK